MEKCRCLDIRKFKKLVLPFFNVKLSQKLILFTFIDDFVKYFNLKIYNIFKNNYL